MLKYDGGILIIDEPNRRSNIEEIVNGLDEFTDAISVPDWPIKENTMFFISLDGKAIQYAAKASRGRKVATQKFHIRFSHFVRFAPEISFISIQSLFDARLENYFIRSAKGMGSYVPPKTWQDLISIVKQLRPDSAKALDELESQLLRPRLFEGPGYQIIIQERDAVNLCLRIFGGRERLLLNWVPPESSNAAPFLQGLRSVTLKEDQIINNDAQFFGDWQRLQQYKVGHAIFDKLGERLTIMNVNRTSVEQTLGVDLIYYHHTYRSYVMVQYKRMTSENGKSCYRPLNDKNYLAELTKMNNIQGSLLNAALRQIPDMDEYRLNAELFYFKLCRADILDTSSIGMIIGMYFPLNYWRLLVNSQNTTGPKGGVSISRENAKRAINNDLFVSLVQVYRTLRPCLIWFRSL
jgi:hypothetical protein